jgi:hypothetical protein
VDFQEPPARRVHVDPFDGSGPLGIGHPPEPRPLAVPDERRDPAIPEADLHLDGYGPGPPPADQDTAPPPVRDRRLGLPPTLGTIAVKTGRPPGRRATGLGDLKVDGVRRVQGSSEEFGGRLAQMGPDDGEEVGRIGKYDRRARVTSSDP